MQSSEQSSTVKRVRRRVAVVDKAARKAAVTAAYQSEQDGLERRIRRLQQRFRLTDVHLDVEATVQDVFEAALRSPGWYRLPVDKRRGWLYAVARNRVVNVLRRLITENRELKAAAGTPTPSVPWLHGVPHVSPEDALVYREVLDVINRLPRQQREVAKLIFIQQEPGPAVAAKLGIEPGTVASHVGRAKKTLRARLAVFDLGWLVTAAATGLIAMGRGARDMIKFCWDLVQDVVWEEIAERVVWRTVKRLLFVATVSVIMVVTGVHWPIAVGWLLEFGATVSAGVQLVMKYASYVAAAAFLLFAVGVLVVDLFSKKDRR